MKINRPIGLKKVDVKFVKTNVLEGKKNEFLTKPAPFKYSSGIKTW